MEHCLDRIGVIFSLHFLREKKIFNDEKQRFVKGGTSENSV